MLTTLYGCESPDDLVVIRAVEQRFGKPIVFFLRICDRIMKGGPAAEEQNGYWHIRVKDTPGVCFVRWGYVDNIVLHGPTQAESLGAAVEFGGTMDSL
jgi:hypothetical protein